jgi:hypothetical protein
MYYPEIKELGDNLKGPRPLSNRFGGSPICTSASRGLGHWLDTVSSLV